MYISKRLYYSTMFLCCVLLSSILFFDIGLLLLFPPLQNQREQNYTVLKTRSNMMTVEGLKPGTTYVFRVRARTDGGYGSYGGEIELETSHEGKKMNKSFVHTSRSLDKFTAVTPKRWKSFMITSMISKEGEMK